MRSWKRKRAAVLRWIVVHLWFATSLAIATSVNDEDYYAYSPSRFLKSYHSLREDVTAQQQRTNSSTDGECDLLSSETSRRPGTKKDLIVAAIQLTSSPSPNHDIRGFWTRAKEAVIDAASSHNASLILLPELFLGPYFCQSQEASLLELANPVQDNFIIQEFQKLAHQLGVVLPISIFERKNNAYYNSVVMIDADGSILGTYRKSHIPDGTGYQEKFYFSPGDSGFKVFDTRVGKVGVGICWDQWFPEAARSMALLGADVLLYPTAIGSEPQDPTLDSARHWQRVMQGHAASNMIPVVASNRYGVEILLDRNETEKQRIRFYGKSFVTDETGEIVRQARDGYDIVATSIDAEANRATRAAWGLFRDRRPELYGTLGTKDGELLQ